MTWQAITWTSGAWFIDLYVYVCVTVPRGEHIISTLSNNASYDCLSGKLWYLQRIQSSPVMMWSNIMDCHIQHSGDKKHRNIGHTLNSYPSSFISKLLHACLAGVTNGQLTHWGRATHIWVGDLIITGSDNGLSPGWCQAIIWSNAGILLIGPLGT